MEKWPCPTIDNRSYGWDYLRWVAYKVLGIHAKSTLAGYLELTSLVPLYFLSYREAVDVIRFEPSVHDVLILRKFKLD